jgi:hypothetical protein
MVEFYTRAGFSKAESEMFLEISGDYEPKGETSYKLTKEDEGRAIMFYDSTCEWGYGSAVRVRDLIYSVEPGYPFDMIDPWEKPVESMRRGNQRLIVNGKVIHSSRRDKEAFLTEIKNVVRGG